MKNTLILILCLFMAGGLMAQQKTHQYLIKSGYVEYALTGSTTGTKKIWWDNYGDLSRTEIDSKSVTKMFGITNEDITKSITIMNGPNYWVVDLEKDKATKGKSPYYDESHQMVDNMTEAEQKKFADDMLASLGGKRLAPESFMGHECEVIEVMGAKSWIYKGITLKSSAEVMGIENYEEATTFEPGKSVPASKFTPDSSKEYRDMSNMMQQMMQQGGDE